MNPTPREAQKPRTPPGVRWIAWASGAGLLVAALAFLGVGCEVDPNRPPRAPEAEVMALLAQADADPALLAELVVFGADRFALMECATCHRFDSLPATGPSLAGLAGRTVRVHDPLAPGEVRELTADRRWLWESIVHSQAAYVKGFEETTRMSRYAHVLETDEVAGLIAWLETQ